MKSFPLLFLIAFILIALGCNEDARVHVRMYTSSGQILVAVDTLAAPITGTNFLEYVNEGHYDGGSFFRSVRMDNQPEDSIRIEVLQGSANIERRDAFWDPIPLERTNETGLYHVNGAISMARTGPDSATHSFFFCVGDQPSLDFGGMRNPDGQGFAVFGMVLEGMDVVRAIQMGAVDRQSLIEPVSIDSARVE